MIPVILFLAVSILLESSLMTIPITLLIILFASIYFRKISMFFLAFFAGLFLDILAFKNIGWSSFYFMILVFVIFLYQKKFEVENSHFVLALSFISSFGYLFLMGSNHVILGSLLSCIFTTISFMAYNISNKKEIKYARKVYG